MNNKKLKCTLTYGNNTHHLSQIITGFTLLKKQTLLNLTTVFDTKIKESQIHNEIIKVEIGDKVLIYDLADGYQSFHDMQAFDNVLNNVDFYFKRSYDETQHVILKNKKKIKPLGLNYPVSCKGNPFDSFRPKSNNSASKFKEYIAFLRYYKRFHKNIYYPKYENIPSPSNEPYKILYSVRLWNPDTVKKENISKGYPNLNEFDVSRVFEKWQSNLENVTKQRIEIARSLKETFGDTLIGGISGDPYSIKMAPDLIASETITMKYNFMKLLKTNVICVSSEGLHHSIGWKFAEFVAASKAIITDKLRYSLPGDFEKNKNYLEYGNIDELINQTSSLLKDRALINQIEIKNYDYYKNYIKPDRLVLNSLKEAHIL
ncbi:hypothetical protein N8273_02070 [Algibacter sp.]|nr:hypothetical protein [Algibacter sp.]